MRSVPETILNHYDIGSILHVSPIEVGLMHATYEIETKTCSYVLQKLHPLLATDQIGEDFLAVTNFLQEKDFYAPRAILNKDGNVLTSEGKDTWRMQTMLPGRTHDVAKSKRMAKNAGSMLARFHAALSDIDYDFKTTLIMHQTPKEYEKLLAAAQEKSELLKDVQAEFDLIKESLPQLYLPEDLPQRVIHGDPKINNILFDGFENALSMIDLDTCQRSTVLNDLGDAMRSWCGGKEDDPENTFRKDIFDAAMEGYKKHATFLTEDELEYLNQSVQTITLELAARFLADYFNDSYFGWNAERYESRRAHNLARCRGQIALYKDMKQKMG